MNAEIITIGDELLLGQVIDTNAAWLGQELNKNGLRVHFKSTISDTHEAILKALYEAQQRSDVVVLTGGLGPTKDDVTKIALAQFFNTRLILNQKVLDWVTSIFSKRNLPMLESNQQQAMVPENCEVLWNKNGTAPGMWFFENDTAYISMPGVPFEMKSIFEEEAIPKLKSVFTFPEIIHRTLQTCSIGESYLADLISPVEENLPSYIKLAYLPDVGSVRLRFSAYGSRNHKPEAALNQIIKQVYELAGQYIFGEESDTLQKVVGKMLKEKNYTIATAESCTGGFVSHLLTSVAGSSVYFKGGIVAYANEIKINELYVDPKILESAGAVSEACVIAMAENLCKKMKTDYGIATSGIAGPDGGSIDKPVGTVWIALATPDKTITRKYNMGDNRERTIQRTALVALDMLRKNLSGLVQANTF
ncbi:MAG: competence/damage-inducible protein A [Bacteroidia bacterium]|nr:competence/damage-inducible protein A [Bacteroidia bacterium]